MSLFINSHTHQFKLRSKPSVFTMATVVIIPGSFAPPSLYEPLSQSFARDGIQSLIVDLPSVGRKDGKNPATMSDDVDEIVSVVEKSLIEDKEVILLAHSYGGVPSTQSLEKLSQKARQSEGKKGGVTKIVYIAGVALPVGGSVMSLLTAPEFLVIEAS
jgi:alpha-beta hydrolase superfamily lysophospholipase